MKPYYEHGGITIYHGDCREILPNLYFDFLLIDPDYEIVATGGGIGARRSYLKKIQGFTDHGFDPSFLRPYKRWAAFCSLKQIPYIIAEAKRRWMLITWNKPDPTPLINNNYLPDTEYIIHSFPDGSDLHGSYRDRSRFIICPAGNSALHPNEKPIPVMKKMISVGATVVEVVLDCFMGSGTTLRAAKDLGRKAIGIEIEERYCEIAAERMSQEVLEFERIEAYG